MFIVCVSKTGALVTMPATVHEKLRGKRKRCRQVAGNRIAKRAKGKKSPPSMSTASKLMLTLAAGISMMCPVAAGSFHSQTANTTDAESLPTKSNSMSAPAPTTVQYVSATLSGLTNFMEVGTCAASKRPGGQRLPTGMDTNVPVYLIRVQDKGAVKPTTMYWAFTPQDAEVGGGFPHTLSHTYNSHTHTCA